MPRCYPPEPLFAEERAAERAVFERLREQLPDDAALLYSVGLTEDGREREADLVVIWPSYGIAVIEVKGGHVTSQQRQWYQESQGRRRAIDSPVTQAQDCRHMLCRYLLGRGIRPGALRSAHLVAFPFTRVPSDWSSPDCSRERVIAKDDLTYAADMVRKALGNASGSGPVDSATAAKVEEVLEASLLGQTSLLAAAEEHEHRVDILTRQQLKVLDHLRYHPRALITGGAGSGKTWLALEQTRRLAKAGQRVALVCYSRGLARWFQRMTATWPQEEEPAYVGLYHQLGVLWGAAPGAEDDSDYWERRLPISLGELAAAKPVEERFDAVVVDEAQDFGELWWPPMLACLRDPHAGGLFVFLDEAQRVFARHGKVPIELPPYALGENVRNTKSIVQVFGSLSAERMQVRCGLGPPVRFHSCSTDGAIDRADDLVDALLGEGWEAGQIALLTTYHRHPKHASDVERSGWDAYWRAHFDEAEVFYGHVLGFKGLERPVVILAVNGFRDAERAKEMLYVGLSRARTLLCVCGDLDLIRRVGGGGVATRLSGART